MGATLRVLAMGPFTKEVLQALEYPDPWYEGIADGRKVVTCVIKTITTSSSEVVAECFNAKLFDFGTHYGCAPDLAKVEQAVIEGVLDEDEEKHVQVLYENGFRFLLLVDA